MYQAEGPWTEVGGDREASRPPSLLGRLCQCSRAALLSITSLRVREQKLTGRSASTPWVSRASTLLATALIRVGVHGWFL